MPAKPDRHPRKPRLRKTFVLSHERLPASVSAAAPVLGDIESRYLAATNLLDGYVHESQFLHDDSSPDHRIVWASEGFAAVYGCTVAQYNRGAIWGGLYHPTERDAALQRAAALRRGETVEAELRLQLESGETRWLYVKNQPIVDPLTGKVTGVLGLGLDITQRKLCEQLQKRTQSILGSVTRSDPDWLLLVDCECRVQFFNRPIPTGPAAFRIGMPVARLFAAHDQPRVESACRSALAGGAPVMLDVDVDWGAGGEYMEIRAVPVREDAHITGLAVRITDISAHRRDQETLLTHAIILETMHEGVIVFDAAGIVRYSNQAADHLFGMDAARLPGSEVSRLGIEYQFDPRSGEPPEARRSFAPEVMCRCADGTEFLAKLAFTELYLREQVMAIGVLRDVTEQKQLEREIIDSVTREQQRIAVELHDGLGQELTGVSLMLRSLADRNVRDFPAIAAAVEEIILLVTGAIDEVRTLAHGLSPVELQRGGLAAALDALAVRTQAACGIAVRFHARTPQGMPVPAPVANHLYRIAQEAVSNAVRHSGAAHVRIALVAREHTLELSVADDGRGISGGRSPQGGIGLRIMEYRARMIGTRVNIRSRAPGGTTITCRVARSAVEPQNVV